MEHRRQLCAQPGATCPPLTWTISNRLADFAPFLLQWYFRCLSPYGILLPTIIRCLSSKEGGSQGFMELPYRRYIYTCYTQGPDAVVTVLGRCMIEGGDMQGSTQDGKG